LQRIALARGRDLSLRRAYRALGDGFLEGILEANPKKRRTAIERAPEPWRSYGLGWVAHAQGDLKGAVRHYGQAIRLEPGHVPSRVALGRVLWAQGRVGAAETQFQAALWLDSSSVGALTGMSAVDLRRGWRDRGLTWALRALREFPSDASLIRKVYEIADVMSDERAIRRAGSVLARLEGNGGVAPFLAARLYEKLGDRVAATEAFECARRGGVTDTEIQYARRARHSPGLARFLEAFRAGVLARYRYYVATGDAETFDEFLAWARKLYERVTGDSLDAFGEPISYSYVGKFIDPTAASRDGLVLAAAREGVLILLGQRYRGPPEAIVAEIDRREPACRAFVRGREVEREVLWLGAKIVPSFSEYTGSGELAGLALDGVVLVDRQAVAGLEGELMRRRAQLESSREALLGEPALADAPVRSMADPAGVADKLLLSGEVDFGAEVLVHEDAHLVDAERHLPVASHPFRNLLLVVSKGFRQEKILAYLERNAQLTAIAEGSHPRAALVTCCRSLGGRGPHARGYREIVQGMVDEILKSKKQYIQIDRKRVIVQQLHRLSDDEVRALAVKLSKRWGVGE
jgi:Tfp pilus assembly protein PilF